MNTPIIALAALSAMGTLAVSMNSTQDAAPLQFPAASPPATLTQQVGITDVEISYSRPSMKGRKIFGALEPYGNVWRTGANSSSTVTFSTDVTFGGKDVPAGTYLLATIPGEKEWTVILNKGEGRSGTYGYDEKDDQARVTVAPMTLPKPVETLTIGMGDLSSDAATLYIEWETTRVEVKVETDIVEMMVPKIEAAMAGDGPHPYFSAAMFYYENDLDMEKAAAWIDEAVKAQPQAFWVSYRKGLILAKKGDKAGAIEAAKMSMDVASKASGAVKDEYIRLNEALIESLK